MKKFFLLSLLAVLSVGLWSCEKDDDGTGYPFRLVNGDMSDATSWTCFSAETTKDFILETPGDWTVEFSYGEGGGQGWLTSNYTEGKAGHYVLSLTASKNQNMTERTAEVKVICGSQVKTIAVTQNNLEGIVIEQTRHSVTHGDTTLTITVSANTNFEYSISASAQNWITPVDAAEASKATTDTEVRFAIARNALPVSRSGIITFMPNPGEGSVEVTIRQDAFPVEPIEEQYAMFSGEVLGNVSYMKNADNSIDAWFVKSTPKKIQNEKHMYNGTGWWYAILDNSSNRHWGSVKYDLGDGPIGMYFEATIAFKELCYRGFGSKCEVALYPWDTDYATTIAKTPIFKTEMTGSGSDDWWVYATDDQTFMPAGEYLFVVTGNAGSGVWYTEETKAVAAQGYINGQPTDKFLSLSYNGRYENDKVGFDDFVAIDYTNIVRSRSTDGGKTWSTPKAIFSLNKAKLDSDDLQRLTHISVGHSNGKYYAVLSGAKTGLVTAMGTSDDDWTLGSTEEVFGDQPCSYIVKGGTHYFYYIKDGDVYVATKTDGGEFTEKGTVLEVPADVKNVSVAYNTAKSRFEMIYAQNGVVYKLFSATGTEEFGDIDGLIAGGLKDGMTYVDYFTGMDGSIADAGLWIGYVNSEGAWVLPVK